MKVIGRRAMMYLAHPTRIWKAGKSGRIVKFAREMGFSPVNPFTCGDFQDFEGGAVGRGGTIQWTLHLQRGCYWSGYFGISEGVMQELRDRLNWDADKCMRVFYEDDSGVPFDPLWEEEYAVLSKQFGDLLAELRGPHRIIALVGSRAVGKTYWSERLLKLPGVKCERVRNTTTREPRNEQDRQYYNFVTKEQFSEKAEEKEFLEYVHYDSHYYGSSLREMREVLQKSHGIFAITPEGAAALYRCRFEMNVEFVLMKAPPAVFKKNLERRGIFDPAFQEKYIKDSERFVLPPSIPHQTIELIGMRCDESRVFDVLSPLLSQH